MRESIGRLAELELGDGEMKEIEVGERSVLLARRGERLFALGAKCPHYGAPLADGTLSGTRIVCPWHQATFDVESGALLEPPALDCLARYEVSTEGDEVFVDLPPGNGGSRRPEMAARDPERDPRTFVILGAGAAGSAAAETLREEGFRGRLLLVSEEERPPYDRPKCSKSYLAGEADAEGMPLRGADFYRDAGIERKTARIETLDVARRRVELAGEDALEPDAMLLATGAVAERLPVEGADLDGVHTLRSWRDADELHQAAEDAERIAVIGASFIGLEVAASLSERGLASTVVAPEAVPLLQAFGEEVGKVVQKLHEENGTRFALGHMVRRLRGNGHVEALELDDGRQVEADLVVMGVGVRPATDFVEGVALNGDGSLDVDEELRVAEGVWAAGDVARFPNAQLGGARCRIEHWRLAQQHGRAAARSMLGRGAPFRGVPFFWTRQFGVSFGYVGYTPTVDELIMVGEPQERDFLAFYVHEGRALAASGTRTAALGAFAELLRDDRMPPLERLREDGGGALRQQVSRERSV